MKPRYEPAYDQTNYPKETLVGYIEEFDMYIDETNPDGDVITLIGERLEDQVNNFDTFRVNGNELERVYPTDLNITPYHMCLIYAKAIEHGVIKEAPNETTET